MVEEILDENEDAGVAKTEAQERLKVLSKRIGRDGNSTDGFNWSELDGAGWVTVLIQRPEFADRCQWAKLTGSDIVNLLIEKPQLSSRCEGWKSRLSSTQWKDLLIRQPRFADECDIGRLRNVDVVAILSRQASLVEKFSASGATTRLSAEEWAKLLVAQPVLISKCEKLAGFSDKLLESLILAKRELCVPNVCDRISEKYWAQIFLKHPEVGEGRSGWMAKVAKETAERTAKAKRAERERKARELEWEQRHPYPYGSVKRAIYWLLFRASVFVAVSYFAGSYFEHEAASGYFLSILIFYPVVTYVMRPGYQLKGFLITTIVACFFNMGFRCGGASFALAIAMTTLLMRFFAEKVLVGGWINYILLGALTGFVCSPYLFVKFPDATATVGYTMAGVAGVLTLINIRCVRESGGCCLDDRRSPSLILTIFTWIVALLIAASMLYIGGDLPRTIESAKSVYNSGYEFWFGQDSAPESIEKHSEPRAAKSEKNQKDEKLRSFALKDAPSLWGSYQEILAEVSTLDENLKTLRKTFQDFDRNPEEDADYKRISSLRNELDATAKSLYGKLEDAYLAAKKFEAKPSQKEYEELRRKILEDGIREAESATQRYRKMKDR